MKQQMAWQRKTTHTPSLIAALKYHDKNKQHLFAKESAKKKQMKYRYWLEKTINKPRKVSIVSFRLNIGHICFAAHLKNSSSATQKNVKCYESNSRTDKNHLFRCPKLELNVRNSNNVSRLYGMGSSPSQPTYSAVSYTHLDVYKRQYRYW